VRVRGQFIIKPPSESDTTRDNASAIGTKRELLVKQIQHRALADILPVRHEFGVHYNIVGNR
jgi:hypothetical protein